MLQVSIIIPTYKDSPRLSKCLKALAEQSYDPELFEVIVVNNAPEEILPEFPFPPVNLTVVNEPGPGSYLARNTGLGLANGKIIGFTDSDCVPDQDWIKNAVAHFEEDQEIKRISGPVKIFCNEKGPSTVELYDTIYAFPQKKYAIDGLGVTANLFVRKEVFDAVGIFNGNTMSGGDMEWGSRAQKAGNRLTYYEDVVIKHPARDSPSSLITKARRVGKGQVIFFSKNEKVLDILVEILRGLRPKTWEVKRIFQEGSDIGFFKKIYLVFIRHLELWNIDFWRISLKTRRMLNLKIRN